MNLYSPTSIKGIKDKYNFKLSKSLGQNFMTDKNIVDKIIEGTHIEKQDLVIEIGPGIGVLTSEAAELAGKVIAIELDSNLVPILKDTLSQHENIEIINQDILKTDLNYLLEQNEIIDGQTRKGVKILGNLPYYITTPIIMKILEDGVKADSITIMLQKEVADRIKAGPGTKTYGAISVAVQYYCQVVHITNVPREVFYPPPKVDSAVIRLDIRKEKPVSLINEKTFFAAIKGAFGQRRKTLHNSITGVCGLSKSEAEEVLEKAGIDKMRRGETLSIEEFAVLANEIDKRRNIE